MRYLLLLLVLVSACAAPEPAPEPAPDPAVDPAVAPELGAATGPAAGAAIGAAQQPRSRNALLDGARVHYLDVGNDDDVLVMVHGWASDVSFFEQQVADLAGRVRLLVVDLPGHGASDEPNVDYSMNLFARAVEAVLDDAGVEHAFLVAHSNGVPVARQAWRQFPERIRGLVLIDGTLRQMEVTDFQRQLVAQFKSPDYPQHAEQLVDSLSSFAPEELRPHIREVMLATSQEALAGGFEAAMDPAIWGEDPIDVPTLVLQAQSPFWDASYEEYVRGLVPQLDYRVLEGVSHFLHMEVPDVFLAALSEFLSAQSVDGFE